MKVRTGLDRWVEDDFNSLKGLKVGLLAHPASIDSQIRHIVSLFAQAGVQLRALFGPEHGFMGAAQDMEGVDERVPIDPVTGARIFSLYGTQVESLYPTPEMFSGLDVLVVDLQDIGARYYTYAATMGYVMQTAAKTNTRVVVLDRPNPIGGRDADIEGPSLRSNYHSFVGAFPMAIRHGFTLGEYARWIRAKASIDVELDIIQMEGWSRDMDFEATGLPWVMPSPNMPTNDVAWIYPGQCLLEGTNLSEGRGTTRPFELCGAPWLDGHAWAAMAAPEVGLGVTLRPTVIKPMFQKHAGEYCGAVQVHVLDRWQVRPVRLTLALLWAAKQLGADNFGWRTDAYEFVDDQLAIDLLFGSDIPRKMLEEGAEVSDIIESYREEELEFVEARRDYLLYE